MEIPLSAQEKIEHQFDTLMKQVLKGEARNCKAKLVERAACEIPFSDLSDGFIETIKTYDEYPSDYFQFSINGFNIVIKDELLGEAVNSLSEQKRNIVLMSYFLEMSDYQIADFLKIVRTTVTYRRHSALKILKELMEELADDE